MSARPETLLGGLRASIDRVDTAIVDLLAERFSLTERIGEVKRDAGMPPLDAEREAELLRRLGSRAAESGLAPEIVERIYTLIMAEVRRRHEELRDAH